MTPDGFKAIRRSIGSQREVADMLGVNRRTIERMEHGHSNFVDDAGQVPDKYTTMILDLDRELNP